MLILIGKHTLQTAISCIHSKLIFSKKKKQIYFLFNRCSMYISMCGYFTSSNM
jgi:hypothetical protein